MLPYFTMFGVPSLTALFASRRLQAGLWLWVVFLLFVAIIGLRWDIGPDWFAYTTHFDRYDGMAFGDMLAEGEFGWIIAVHTADALGLGMTGIVMFSAVVFCTGLFAVARSTEEPMVAIVAAVPYLCIAVAMSGLRQATAIGLVFLVVAQWYRWSLPTKIGVILLAATFHFSALALLLIVVLSDRLTLLQKVAVGIAVGAVVTYLATSVDARVDEYASRYTPGGAAANASGALFHVMLTGAPSVVYFVLRRRWIEVYGRAPVIDLFAAVGVAAIFAVFVLPTATDRMTLYFSAVALIIQANLPSLWTQRAERTIARFVIIVLNLIAMTTFLTLGNKARAFVPYEWIFSEQAQYEINQM